jgi:hypothetical protein
MIVLAASAVDWTVKFDVPMVSTSLYVPAAT